MDILNTFIKNCFIGYYMDNDDWFQISFRSDSDDFFWDIHYDMKYKYLYINDYGLSNSYEKSTQIERESFKKYLENKYSIRIFMICVVARIYKQKI